MRKAVRGVLLIGLAILSVVVAPPAAHAKQGLPIAEARSQPLGTTVTVQGAVTVPSGAFTSFSFDEGFAIQDRSGGIYVSLATDLDLRPGQKVRVTGRLADSFGLLVVATSPAEVRVLHGRKKIRPEQVATGEVNESTEGRLLRIVGTITRPVGDDRPFGFRLFVDDSSGELQVFIATTTGIDPFSPRFSFLQPGQRVTVIGFSGQFEDHYELNPRFPSDIRPARPCRRC